MDTGNRNGGESVLMFREGRRWSLSPNLLPTAATTHHLLAVHIKPCLKVFKGFILDGFSAVTLAAVVTTTVAAKKMYEKDSTKITINSF